MENKDVFYKWREPFRDVYHQTRCEVLDYTDKTARIRLLGFGKNQTKPYTIIRVHLKSLVGFELPKPEPEEEPEWHRYSYFD